VVFLNSPPLGKTPLDELMFNVTGAFAQYERSKITERMRRGWLHKVKSGERIPQPAPYGYRYLPAQNGEPSCWMIDPSASPVVEEAFRWYTDEGLSVREIAKRLNEAAIPSPQGGIWRGSVVERVLHNQSYTGQGYYNQSYKDHATDGTLKLQGRGRIAYPRSSPRPRAEWIPFSVPQIISPQTWQKAQERMEQNARLARRNSKRHYLLSGLLVCGVCEHTLYATTYEGQPYYRCPAGGKDRPESVPPHTMTVKGAVAEQVIWDALSQLLQAPERIEQAWESCRAPDQRNEVARLEKQLRQLQDQRERLLDAYQTGLISKRELAERQNPLSVAMETVADSLRESRAWKTTELSLAKFTQQIERALDTSDPELQREIIRLLIERIIVEKDALVVEHIVPTTSQIFQLRPQRLCGEFCVCSGLVPSRILEWSRKGRPRQ